MATERASTIGAEGAAVRPRSRRIAPRLLRHAVLLAFSALFSLPFYWLLSSSLKNADHLFVYPPEWIPRQITLANYLNGLRFVPFTRFTQNSMTVALTSVVGAVLSNSLSAYGLARIDWPGRKILFAVLLGTMMIPFQVRMVPLFLIFRNLDWLDTFLPLIVPSFFGSPFLIFLLRQFFLTFPRELDDAARIDGASEFGIFWWIVVPLAKPALAVVALFTFIGHWEDLLGPLIYLTSREKYTVSIGLALFRGEYSTEYGPLMAASFVMILPVIVLFFLTQRTFIQGITLTGIKG